MVIKQFTVNVVTDSGGDFNEVMQGTNGIFWQIKYIPDPTSPLATGADLTITEDTEVAGYNVLTMANIGTSAFDRAPRQLTCTASDGVEGTTQDYVVVAKDVTLVIANGGNVKSGTFYVCFMK